MEDEEREQLDEQLDEPDPGTIVVELCGELSLDTVKRDTVQFQLLGAEGVLMSNRMIDLKREGVLVDYDPERHIIRGSYALIVEMADREQPTPEDDEETGETPEGSGEE